MQVDEKKVIEKLKHQSGGIVSDLMLQNSILQVAVEDLQKENEQLKQSLKLESTEA